MATKSNKSAAQQQALDAARAAKSRKATITDVPFVETEAAQAQAASPEEAKANDFMAYYESIIAGLPSWKRVLVALVISSLVAWGLGTLAGTAVAYLVVGAMVLGASTFVATIIFWLGIIAGVYASYRGSAFCYIKIVDKSVDRAFDSAKGWVTGLFTSSKAAA